VWQAQYEEPPHLEPEEAEAILAAGIGETDTDEARAVQIGLVLFDDDRAFVEHWCVRLGRQARDPQLRGSAALAAGHLARPFQTLEPETWEMVETVAADPQVDSRKYDTLDDIRQFLRVIPEHWPMRASWTNRRGLVAGLLSID
jgi:hypothetical protein